MKISVAMATYNGEKYIERQLDSIRMQTREVDEVIICDDQSKDRTVEVIEKYIEQHQLQGWSISVNEENKLPARIPDGRNAGSFLSFKKNINISKRLLPVFVL